MGLNDEYDDNSSEYSRSYSEYTISEINSPTNAGAIPEFYEVSINTDFPEMTPRSR